MRKKLLKVVVPVFCCATALGVASIAWANVTAETSKKSYQDSFEDFTYNSELWSKVTGDASVDLFGYEKVTETFDDAELNGFTAVGTGETFCVENGKLVSKGASTGSQ